MLLRTLRILGISVAVATGFASPAFAPKQCPECGGGGGGAVFYVDDDHPMACACTYPSLNTDVMCGAASKPYSCVADGVKKSAPGDTVSVADGTYNQCFTIANSGGGSTSRITIIAANEGGALIAKTSSPTCTGINSPITWSADHVVLHGFNVTGGTGSSGAGIRLTTSANSNFVIKVSAYGNRSGIGIEGPSNTVRDSTIYDNSESGVLVLGAANILTRVISRNNAGHGIRLETGSDSTLVSDGQLHDNGLDGLFIGSADNVSTNLIAFGNRDGVHISSSGNTLSGGNIYGNLANIRVYDDYGAYTSPVNNRISGVDIHHSRRYMGIGLEAMTFDSAPNGTIIENSHVHHNYQNGIFEARANNTTIVNCEVDNNGGAPGYAHGLYLRGTQGLVQSNRVHHNSSYGIQLWAAPKGTSSKHYIVERNEVFANGTLIGGNPDGGGIVLGGGPQERDCPGTPSCSPCVVGSTGLPEYIDVRYNVSHHNTGPGLHYLIGMNVSCGGDESNCNTLDGNNTFHHNITYGNHVELQLRYANAEKILIKDNIFVGRSGAAHLVSTSLTNLPANALDGNLYFRTGADPNAPLFAWNGLGPYSFSEVVGQGVRQDPQCGGSDGLEHTDGNDPRTVMDTRSAWSGTLAFVDPRLSLWNTASANRYGDFHLLPGSSGISGGVCCQQSNGGHDLDDESVQVCSPENCVAVATGIGADFYFDSDADGIANRYDCAPHDGLVATICDGDPVAGNLETCGAYAGAPFDPGVYPSVGGNLGATEICDGKDNDCNGAYHAAGESDADQDGFFTCDGDAEPDCSDGDRERYPGHLEWCDNGKDNDCIASTGDGVPEFPDDLDNDCDGLVDESS